MTFKEVSEEVLKETEDDLPNDIEYFFIDLEKDKNKPRIFEEEFMTL